MVGVHAQSCVANDLMLLSTLNKALALCARSLHNTRNALCFLYVRVCTPVVVVVVVVVVQSVRRSYQ